MDIFGEFEEIEANFWARFGTVHVSAACTVARVDAAAGVHCLSYFRAVR